MKQIDPNRDERSEWELEKELHIEWRSDSLKPRGYIGKQRVEQTFHLSSVHWLCQVEMSSVQQRRQSKGITVEYHRYISIFPFFYRRNHLSKFPGHQEKAFKNIPHCSQNPIFRLQRRTNISLLELPQLPLQNLPCKSRESANSPCQPLHRLKSQTPQWQPLLLLQGLPGQIPPTWMIFSRLNPFPSIPGVFPSQCHHYPAMHSFTLIP